MYQQSPKKGKRGCLQVMRDQAWGFVFGFLSLVVALASLILAIPQAAPIRSGIAQTFSGSSKLSENTPMATTQPVSGTILFNRELSCNGCVTPFIITIDQAVISPIEQNMVWTVKALNRSGEFLSFDFTQFTLQGPSGNSYPGTGSFLTNAYAGAGQTTSGAVTFPLIPNKGETYILAVSISIGGNFPDVSFNPASFAF